MPLGPAPFFSTLSEQPSDHDVQPVINDDEDPIIPPTPPKSRSVPVPIPIEHAHDGHKTEKGPIVVSVPTLSIVEGDARVERKKALKVAPLFKSHRNASPRARPTGPQQGLLVAHEVGRLSPGELPTAETLRDTNASQHRMKTIRDTRQKESDAKGSRNPAKGQRRLGSPQSKHLENDAPDIVVDIPRTGVEKKYSAMSHSGDHTVEQMTSHLFPHDDFETNGHSHPTVGTLPPNHKSDDCMSTSFRPQHTTTRRGSHATRRDSADSIREPCEDVLRPPSPPREHRSQSRSRATLDNNIIRRALSGSEHDVRRENRDPEFSGFRRSPDSLELLDRRGGQRSEFRRNRIISPAHRTDSPSRLLSTFRDENPPILSPFPVRAGLPLPAILTEPIVDIERSRRPGAAAPHPVAEVDSEIPHEQSSPHGLHSGMPIPTPDHHISEQKAHSTVKSEFTAGAPQGDGPINTRTTKYSSSITPLSIAEPKMDPEAVSPRPSPLGVSITQNAPPKHFDARSQESPRQKPVPLPFDLSTDAIRGRSPQPRDLNVSTAGLFRDVGTSGVPLFPHQVSENHELSTTAGIQMREGNSKPTERHKRRKMEEKRLSTISEQSEPKLPSVHGSKNMIQSSDDNAGSDSDHSEQTRDAIFLTHQAERQQIANEISGVQRLSHEQLLSNLQGPNCTKTYSSGTGKKTDLSPHQSHAHGPVHAPLSSTTSEVIVAPVMENSYEIIVPNGSVMGTGTETPVPEAPAMTPNDAQNLYRSVGAMVNDSRNSHPHIAASPLAPTSRVTENIQSDQVNRLLESLKDGGRISPVMASPYSLELENERTKARLLEEEIRKTKNAIQAIKEERAAANEMRRLDALASISNVQSNIRSQLRSIADQMIQLKEDGNCQAVDLEEEPAASFEDGITVLVNRIHEGQAAERRLKAGDPSIAESQYGM